MMAEKAAALVKPFFPHPSPKEWPANPEEACIKHSHFLKLKTGEKTHPSVLAVIATMRGQQPGKGTPEKKQPGKGTRQLKKMAALPVAKAETVEPEKAWTPTKRLRSKTSPILMVSAEELSGVEEDEVLSVLSSSGTAVSSLLCGEQLVKAGAVMKKPATGNCTAVKKRPGSLQKAAGPKTSRDLQACKRLFGSKVLVWALSKPPWPAKKLTSSPS